MESPLEKIPVVVLTGFLGSGKTTWLGKALRSPGMADTAVIINEAGEMGLDHLLVEAVEEQIYELPSGCLCCLRRVDIVTTLRDLIERRADGRVKPFRRIVIETSGLADPAPILYTLAADPMLGHEVTLGAVVTLVDCVAGESTLARHPEAISQVAVADRILLSKSDLAPPSDELLAKLDALNGWAERLTPGSDADPAALILASGASAVAPRLRRLSALHTSGIVTASLVLERPPSRFEFARALGTLASERGEDLLRMKGLIAFADRPDRIGVVHAVQHTIYRPDWLERWPDADDRSRLVFITRKISAAEIFDRFAAFSPRQWSAREITSRQTA
jgi:G3E family GTPase